MMDKYALRERGIADERVLAAMERVSRESFVPPEYAPQALEDHPLPIGLGQTISQPYMVAAMSEMLRLTPASRVLEIGTGSGFQTAILAELAAEGLYRRDPGRIAGRGTGAAGPSGLHQRPLSPGRWLRWLGRLRPLRWHPGDLGAGTRAPRHSRRSWPMAPA